MKKKFAMCLSVLSNCLPSGLGPLLNGEGLGALRNRGSRIGSAIRYWSLGGIASSDVEEMVLRYSHSLERKFGLRSDTVTMCKKTMATSLLFQQSSY
ncbi:hypothetical protein F4677DRAFT_11681 [Hypoxylon crocopeplum]|nr:hypothetical protein F4677DRAFT_11681 [Hypoxylon crocopeplum]